MTTTEKKILFDMTNEESEMSDIVILPELKTAYTERWFALLDLIRKLDLYEEYRKYTYGF